MIDDRLYVAAAMRERARLLIADRELARKLTASTAVDVTTFS